MVVAWAEVSAEVDMEDKKGKGNSRFLNRQVILRKNTNQRRELNENIDLW